MKNLLIAASMLVPTAAIAQQQPATPQPPTYTITLSPAAIDQVGAGIQELPAKIANPLLNEITRQIKEQHDAFVKAQAPKAPAEAEKAKP